MKILKELALFLFFAPFAMASAPSWHVLKSEECGVLPHGAFLKSVTLQEHADLGGEATVTAVVFSEKSYRLQIVDCPERDKTVAQVMSEGHFVAGVNGGYFRFDGSPLGLVVSHGVSLHSQEKAPKLLSGFIVVANAKIKIVRVGENIPSSAQEVLQAGPFFIDHHLPVSGLESTKMARRTFLATDGHGNWIMGVISPVTLAQSARLLMAAAPQLLRAITPAESHRKSVLERALNLDGGSSSALWVNLPGKPFSQIEVGRVRNFLALSPKG